jgi:hypothetical protein
MLGMISDLADAKPAHEKGGPKEPAFAIHAGMCRWNV